jgi:hygromycin-B 7''-O-kinase
MDVELWAPFVRQVCERHSFSCKTIRSSVPGTCPVFIVDEHRVVKFFGRLFHGEQAYAAERTAGDWLDRHPVLPHARLLAEGQLQPAGARWHWPYLVYDVLAGCSLREVYKNLAEEQLFGVARQLGTWVRGLHTLELPGTPPFEANWNRFQRFLENQWATCAARQQAWNSLPPRLIDQIDEFLPPLETLLEPASRPCLIHADLTADHLLGIWAQGQWNSQGIIDFGDSRAGNLEYELTVLHLDLFHGNRHLLAAFLDAYDFQPGTGFSKRMLAYSLLHEFDLFAPYAGGIQAQNMTELVEELWSI